MEKRHIDRRMRQMEAEGVEFRPGVEVGVTVSVKSLMESYDAIVAEEKRQRENIELIA
jgi:glutamate synthase (NADPH/NADH) small chain